MPTFLYRTYNKLFLTFGVKTVKVAIDHLKNFDTAIKRLGKAISQKD